MKSPIGLILTVLALVLAAAGPSALAEDVRIDVVVDMTVAGKKVARPTPGNPTYYLPIPVGYKEIGAILVHYVRPPPPPAEVEQWFTEALAEQGYLVATGKSPPSIILVYSWGYIAPQIVGRNKAKKGGIGSTGAVILNEPEVLSMLAGDQVDVSARNLPPPWMAEILAAERHPRYYLLVSAFDFKAWQSHQMVVLWRAHITVPLWGHYLDQMLPTLITSGAPALGQDIPRPQLFTTPYVPPGQVIVGTPIPKN